MNQRATRALVGCLIFLSGCYSTFTGKEIVSAPPPEVTGKPVQASIWIAPPVVEDQDGDFTSVVKTFSTELQRVQRQYIESAAIFSRCPEARSPGDYTVTTQLRVTNYRSPGGWPMLLLSGFLPPLLGLAWGIPVAHGAWEGEVRWTLTSPAGEKIHSDRAGFPGWAPGVEGYAVGDKAFNRFLKAAAQRIAALAAATPTPATSSAASSSAPPTPQPAPAVSRAAAGPRPIIAVFDVHDATNKLPAQTLVQLSVYLSTKLTETGRFKVIPRDQLRKRLTAEKKESYKACVDQTCQIELGKALAAQKSLSTRLLEVGGVCAITAELYDLKTETAERAATTNTDCTAGGLMAGIDKVVRKLRPR